MKQHIGPIYFILGIMAVSALTIGASRPLAKPSEHQARAQAMLPSPTMFQLQVARADKPSPARSLVIDTSDVQLRIQAQVAKAIGSARACKAG